MFGYLVSKTLSGLAAARGKKPPEQYTFGSFQKQNNPKTHGQVPHGLGTTTQSKQWLKSITEAMQESFHPNKTSVPTFSAVPRLPNPNLELSLHGLAKPTQPWEISPERSAQYFSAQDYEWVLYHSCIIWAPVYCVKVPEIFVREGGFQPFLTVGVHRF